MTEIRLALDRASVRSVDQDGHLHVSLTPISKGNVCGYLGREIPGWQELGLAAEKIYNLYRDPAELEKAAETFNGKPLLFGHKPISAEDHDHDMTVGAVTGAVWKAPYLMAALDIWSGAAIKEIESGRQEQLSSCYRYTPVMQSGITPDGVRFDGRMTQISANHVALVPEGRAGSDVLVLDSKLPSLETIFMTAKAHSRAADVARGALMIYLRPKMAADAKIDLGPVLKGVTSKSFASKKPGIKTALDAVLKGKLAKDADISDVTELLDALEGVIPEEAMDEDDEDEKKKKAKPAEDADETDEEKEKRMAKEKADAEKDKKAEDARMKTAQDEAVAAATKDMVTKSDLAVAVKVAQDAAAQTQRDIRDAERAVRPWVGDLAMSFDSAPDVYRTALKVLKVEGAEKLHPDALMPILQAQPQPGVKQPRATAPLGQDAAAGKSFVDRYPAAGRIGHA